MLNITDINSGRNIIETVIFDMDGVIIDSEPIHRELQGQLFQKHNISLGPEEYQTYIGRSSKNMWQELIEKFSLLVTVEEILEQDRDLYHKRLRCEPDLGPIPGVSELIQALHGEQVNLILASSSTLESIHLVLELFKLAHFFDHKVSGADLKFSKPHPEIFKVAAGLANSDSNRCLVIEDSSHGVTAAKRADMKCIGFQNPNSGNQDLTSADLIIHNFNELTVERIMELGSK